MNLLRALSLLFVSIFFGRQICSAQTLPSNAWHDPSSHHSEMITVAEGIQLEVLDWGGAGQPLIFLSGLGNTAHIWDNFAPKFTDRHHVYAVTRRGFGKSTHATAGYAPERLADDILAVMVCDREAIMNPPSRNVVKQRHEAEVHMELLMAMEQSESRIVCDEIDLCFLVAADHDDILHQA